MAEKVENTSEIVMDAQLMKNVHESVSKLLLANAEFNDGMYSNAIVSWEEQKLYIFVKKISFFSFS